LIIPVVLGMTTAAAWDLKTQKIPNVFTFLMTLFGFVYHGITSGWSGLGFSAAGVGVGIGLFLVPYLMGGMGAGDVKLMGSAGALIGAKGVLMASVMVILAGGVYGIILFAMNPKYTTSFLRRLWLTFKTFALTRQFILIPPGKDEKQPMLCYGVPIALGTMCYLYLKITESNFIQELFGFQFSL